MGMRIRRFVLWTPDPPDVLTRRLEEALSRGDLVGSLSGHHFRLQRTMARSTRGNPFALTLHGRIDPDPDGSAVAIDVVMSWWLPFMVVDLLVLAALLPWLLPAGMGLCFAAFFGGVGLLLPLGARLELRRLRPRWAALVDPTGHFAAINAEASPGLLEEPEQP